MANYAVTIAIIVGIVCGQALSVVEDADRSLLGLNLPYGRGLDSELQLARLMLLTPRFCHPKRNSELINSLLSLPKNMHNAGK
ncbi:pigment-dispersing hormone peptides [Formica exsecta]|uniref:pigment-dispersing hormone peptides n=1 Tax=Formica exsecta TaxID=72781 RepID=UPI001144FA14|nr:pigment-dispersing hormone peptides [Formica exsecta]XP_029674846.1 pigment-dispersing hormone peptides [Formica exsecta]